MNYRYIPTSLAMMGVAVTPTSVLPMNYGHILTALAMMGRAVDLTSVLPTNYTAASLPRRTDKPALDIAELSAFFSGWLAAAHAILALNAQLAVRHNFFCRGASRLCC